MMRLAGSLAPCALAVACLAQGAGAEDRPGQAVQAGCLEAAGPAREAGEAERLGCTVPAAPATQTDRATRAAAAAPPTPAGRATRTGHEAQAGSTAQPTIEDRLLIKEAVRNRLRTRLQPAAPGKPDPLADLQLVFPSGVRELYTRRAHLPVWTNSSLRPPALELLAVTARADREGLDPEDYHAARLAAAAARIRGHREGGALARGNELADFELLATDAYLTYASHAVAGRRNPAAPDGGRFAAHGADDAVEYLQAAAMSGSVAASLRALLPQTAEYAGLRKALAIYRRAAKAGGWPEMPPGGPLQPGNRDFRVPFLRARMRGEPGATLGDNTVYPRYFDYELGRAVRRFQERHGLTADGLVGPDTLAALNVPARARAEQVAINMERLRRVRKDFGTRYVLVNVAGAELHAIDNGKTAAKMRVVVGHVDQQTPIFSSRLTHFVVNPYWNVPRGIAVNGLLPLIKNDPGYLDERGFRLYTSSGAGELDADAVDWAALGPKNFPYRLRQDPGPSNALGRIKFVFPNRFAVYLHDTPVRGTFVESVRTRSHGCVRLEHPVELAELLARWGRSSWSKAGLLAAIARSKRQTVRLAEPVPVHMVYFTAWADEDGTVHFRNDVYGRDRRLAVSLAST